MGKADESFAVRKVIGVKEVQHKGKIEKQFLVDWAPSYVSENEISAELAADWSRKVVVAGPADTDKNKQGKDLHKMEFVVWKLFNDDPSHDPVVELMLYSKVKQMYPCELFEYFEKQIEM